MQKIKHILRKLYSNMQLFFSLLVLKLGVQFYAFLQFLTYNNVQSERSVTLHLSIFPAGFIGE